MWGVPWLRDAYGSRWGACATLVPRDDVERLFGVPIDTVWGGPRNDGCHVVFKTLTPAGTHRTVLGVTIRHERTADWRLDILTRGTDKPVETWDWDRPDTVHVVTEAHARTVLIGDADEGYVQLELDLETSTDAQVVDLVQRVVHTR